MGFALSWGGGGRQAEVSSCHNVIQMNLEENSSQQPPGMCGGGCISGLGLVFFTKSQLGFGLETPNSNERSVTEIK